MDMNWNCLSKAGKLLVVGSIVGALLAGCGGGGGGGTSAGSNTTQAATTLSGVAAVGSPIVNGSIAAKCAAGSPPATTTNSTGAWIMTLGNGTLLPCAVQVSGGTINAAANTTPYHSIATATGVVNVTPLTDLMVANLSGTATPDIWFNGLNSTPAPLNGITQVNVDATLAALRIALNGLTPLLTINPITIVFTPTAGNVSDDMLTALQTAMTTANVTHAALLSNASAPAFTAPVTGFNTALTTAYTNTTSGSVPRFDVASLTFASQENFTTSAAQTVTLSNTGNTGIAISNYTVTLPLFAKWTVINTTCPVAPSIFAAGANCTFSIVFKPNGDPNILNTYVLNQSLGLNPALPSPVSYSGVLVVTSNSVTNPSVSVQLNGTGVYPPSSSSTPTTGTAPTVTGMSPASGASGTVVTITGTNFDATPANNTVMFNGTQATVTAATATSLTVTVPVGATTGTVTVTTASGTGTSSGSFTVGASGTGAASTLTLAGSINSSLAMNYRVAGDHVTVLATSSGTTSYGMFDGSTLLFKYDKNYSRYWYTGDISLPPVAGDTEFQLLVSEDTTTNTLLVSVVGVYGTTLYFPGNSTSAGAFCAIGSALSCASAGITLNRSSGTITFLNTPMGIYPQGAVASTGSFTLNGTLSFTPF